MAPDYNFDKIKFATDGQTFERAVEIYESDGVKNFESVGSGFSAKVMGSKGDFYNVFVSAKRYDRGNCDCYLGQNETLCKHLVALAIYAVMRGDKLSAEDKQIISGPKCNGRLGELSKEELTRAKEDIALAMRYIKSYTGPSKNWFAYQDSLCEGCARLSKIVSELPVSTQTAKLLVHTLLRLDKKLSYGVDDSDGTVGGFIEEAVLMLQEFVKIDSKCVKVFKKLCGIETMFGWEEPLVKIFDEQQLNKN